MIGSDSILSDQDWTRTEKFQGPLISASCFNVVCSRDEHWTGFELDWIRAMTNFIDFGLDPVCKMLHKFKIRTGFGPS